MITFLAVAFVFLQAAAPPATRGTLTIQGTVTDPSGALIPGVLVTVKRQSNKLPRLAITDEGGRYVLSGLLPGEYELATELSGFTSDRREVQITAPMDINLAVGIKPVSWGFGVSVTSELLLSDMPDPQLKTQKDAENAAAQLWRLTLRTEDLERGTLTNGRSYQAIREFYFFGADAVPALVLALQDEDVQVRRNAAVILAYFAAPAAGQARVDILEALPTLRERLQDADAEVRQIARKVIEAIERGR